MRNCPHCLNTAVIEDGYCGHCRQCTLPALAVKKPAAVAGAATGYAHPTTIQEFESLHRKEYEEELESCDRWIKWCENQNDTHGMNFHQGMRGALVFNSIKMCQLLRVLKQEHPNAASGHNGALCDGDEPPQTLKTKQS